MKKLIRDCFTGIDGETYDLARVLWALGVMPIVGSGSAEAAAFFLRLFGIGLGLPLWSTADWLTYAGAFGVAMGATAGAVWLKRSTEPSVKITRETNDGNGNSATVEAKS